MKRIFQYLFYTGIIVCSLSLSLRDLFHPDRVFASCGSANCFLVTGTQEGISTPGQVIVDLSYRFIPMDKVHRGSKSASSALVPKIDFENGIIVPGGHEEIRTNNELAQLDISYGVKPRFSLLLSIPILNNRTHEHAHVPGNFTREDGTSGFGDIRLVGRYAIRMTGRQLLIGGLGIKAPTGEYKLLDHDGEINEPTIQPGTGSWDGLLSAHYSYQLVPRKMDLFLSTSYQITTENDLDYRMGNILILNGGVDYIFNGSRPTTTSLQINMRHTPRDKFKGEEVPSTGGKWIYITPGVRVELAPGTSIYGHLQLPVYQYVNEENLVPRYGLLIGISRSF